MNEDEEYEPKPIPILPVENWQRLLDERWTRVREDEASGQYTPAGVWAEMLVLSNRLGKYEDSDVIADEMARACDRSLR